MKRILLTLLILTGIGLVQTGAFAESRKPAGILTEFSAPVMLRASALVSSKIISLGDVFANTGDKAQSALAYAPIPGKRAVFDARWLYRVAKAYKLNWRPLSNLDTIVVQRASSIIRQEEIAEQLKQTLVEHGADPNMEIHFSTQVSSIHVAGDGMSEIGFENVNFNSRTLRFSTMMHAPSGDPTAPRKRVTGRLHATTEIPVAARRILKDEIINKSDLRWVKVRTSRLQNDTISNLVDLIGKTPKRGIREGQAIRSSAIQKPILVKKGSLVTIILRANKMLLTAQGKALQPGSEGDVIRIANTQSNHTIEAEVIGSGRAAVRQPTIMAFN
jgi:flagella basal body P-ring formation protein FlgA